MEIIKRFAEKKIRIKTLDRQEKALRDKYQTMQEQISKALGGVPAPSDEN